MNETEEGDREIENRGRREREEEMEMERERETESDRTKQIGITKFVAHGLGGKPMAITIHQVSWHPFCP